MTTPLLVDTDVMVDFLRGHPKAITLLQTTSTRIVLSSISVGELYTGVRGDDELSNLDDLISLFRVIPVTSDLAKAGGLLKNKYAKSHGVGLADAIIAATAIAEAAALTTLNTKHYPMLKGLAPAYIKS